MALFVAVLTLGSGCDTKIGNGTVSTSTFESLGLVESLDQEPIQILSDKIDLLKSILPSEVVATLSKQQSESFPLGTLGLGAGGRSAVLVFEANLRAICSADLCETGECAQANPVSLHYNDVGFEEEMDDLNVGVNFPTFGQVVPSIPVDISRGAGLGGDRWIVAYEINSRSLVGLRARDVGYRNVQNPLDPDDPNFGRGNGLVMSVIISGAEMQSQLGLGTQPRITRIFDLGPDPSSNKHRLLVFFAREVLREVHLLEIEAGVMSVRTDLGPGGGNQNEPVWMLNGQFRLFGTAEDQLEQITQEVDVNIGDFQPIRINTDGSALVFDSISSNFLKIKSLSALDVLEHPGKVAGQGIAEIAVERSTFDDEIGTSTTGREFTESWGHPVQDEIVLVEENSNTIFAYDFNLDSSEDNVRQIVNAIALVSNRRDPNPVAGGGVLINNEEPILLKGEEDVLNNRLMFDRGRDELIAVNYDTGTVVIVAKRASFTDVTGGDLADITYMKYIGVEQPDEMLSIRVWDSSTSSLLKVLLQTKQEPDITTFFGN